MAKKIKYRLQVLLVIRERAKKAKEIDLARAVQKLNEERKKLETLEEEKRVIERRVEEERRLLGQLSSAILIEKLVISNRYIALLYTAHVET